MKFPGVEFLETAPKFRKREYTYLFSCTLGNKETSVCFLGTMCRFFCFSVVQVPSVYAGKRFDYGTGSVQRSGSDRHDKLASSRVSCYFRSLNSLKGGAY